MLRADPGVNPKTVIAPFMVPPSRAHQASLLDPTDQIAQSAAGYSDPGTRAAIDLVHRIRNRYVPAAGFGDARVLSPARRRSAWTSSPRPTARSRGWLRCSCSATCCCCGRSARLLPLKAVLVNMLSVAATYGVLVMLFQHGWGTSLLGLKTSPQIEGWIPIFLFAVLFGLSMDYEVFLLSRMREDRDKTGTTNIQSPTDSSTRAGSWPPRRSS